MVKLVCDGCGNKNTRRYASFNGKVYCSKDCLDTAIKKYNNDPVIKTKWNELVQI